MQRVDQDEAGDRNAGGDELDEQAVPAVADQNSRFVGGGPGRRRPWRLVDTTPAFSDVQPDDESRLAARALSDVIVDLWLRRIQRVQARRHLEPVEWQEVFGGSQGVVIGTADKVRQVVADIRAVLSRHDDRLTDPTRRPADARAVELLVFAQPHSPEP